MTNVDTIDSLKRWYRVDYSAALVGFVITKAIEDDDLQFFRSILDSGFDPNLPILNGFSAVYVAATARGDHAEVLNALIRAGGRVNELTRENLSILYVAAQQGNTRCVEALINAGADVNFQTRGYGSTPLINAAEEGKLGCVQALVESGANVNARNKMGNTALSVARKQGNQDIVRYLLDHNGRE